jgi:hypothetical protein
MAQLKGSILFTGSIGNVRAFYDKKLKRYILATKGGASKEDIMNSPNFARTRENMNEFKACGMSVSQIRKSVLSLSHLFYGQYCAEIVKLIKSIQLHDEAHPRGYRAIETSKAPELLTTLNFNRNHPFDRVLTAHPRITLSDDKKTVTLALPNFYSYSRLHWPYQCSSYRFVLLIAQLPDFEWSEEEGSYRPILPDMEQLSVRTNSDWFAWNSEPINISMEASFAQPALQQPGTTVLVAVGIETSSIMLRPNDSYTSRQGTMKIVECFV